MLGTRLTASISVSILYLTLAQATALNFLAPLGAMVLAKYLSYGTFSSIDRVGGLMAVAGVILVVQPDILDRGHSPPSQVADATPERLKGVACGIVGVLGGIVSPTGNYGGLVCMGTSNDLNVSCRLPWRPFAA